MSPLATLHQIVAPTGHTPVLLDDLLGGPWPEPRTGESFTPCWADCPPCGKATAGAAHTGGWTCGECLTTSPVEVQR
ncbi:hypothetical protein [Streptomyces sp. SID8352]|uniref:hypothetical protein n=1 Tax=Streptomyces sp. SID8352 TaxID=2690338 RepID=UPI00136B498D|nr:hypothetical protein [Streptomyces sp. SID8352]MYU24514.1 hypothetical protein [Streptomyces sp. SID8352]